MTKHTTLAKRGAELAAAPSIRDKFRTILKDPYDPDTNPDGFINLGVAENVESSAIAQVKMGKVADRVLSMPCFQISRNT